MAMAARDTHEACRFLNSATAFRCAPNSLSTLRSSLQCHPKAITDFTLKADIGQIGRSRSKLIPRIIE
jgi:hypothetical protein